MGQVNAKGSHNDGTGVAWFGWVFNFRRIAKLIRSKASNNRKDGYTTWFTSPSRMYSYFDVRLRNNLESSTHKNLSDTNTNKYHTHEAHKHHTSTLWTHAHTPYQRHHSPPPKYAVIYVNENECPIITSTALLYDFLRRLTSRTTSRTQFGFCGHMYHPCLLIILNAIS